MMPASMLAARYYGPDSPLRLEPTPVPQPAPGEALVRVRATGVCHTELHLLDGVLSFGVIPLTPGHEVVGDVVETRGPSAVSNGDRVLLFYYAPCGHCAFCRKGAENLCPNMARQIGFTADGGYAQYLVAPAASLCPLPSSLSDAQAAGLACGAATALHAAQHVGQVQLGEAVVVYGVGGVGFYLIQLCRLLGARVIAIGRTPAKLDLARSLGAESCVDAAQTDPLPAVLQLTDGLGAQVVFDLVASAETLDRTTRMLGRQGRLVFTGYSGARMALDPLMLVLREIHVRGALGSTRDELQAVIDLAASGRLTSIEGPTFALDQVNEALAGLRAGQVLGRAVVLPNGVLSGRPAASEARVITGLARGQAPPRSVSGPAPVAIRSEATESAEAGIVGGFGRGQAPPLRSALVPRAGPRPFEAELLALIGRGVDRPTTDDEFNALALGLFSYQFEHNKPYRQFCESRQRGPGSVDHWTRVPAVPIGAFKEVDLACEPTENAAALFMSSGTTRLDDRSRHYHPDLSVYDASIRANFAPHFLPDALQLPFLVLNPPPASQPNSSLAYYLGVMLRSFGASESDYFVDDQGLRFKALLEALQRAVSHHQPVAALGTTFAFVHLLDGLVEAGVSLQLPAGSRVFDTGGVKGRSREIRRQDLDLMVTDLLGIPSDHLVNMYGLTELSTQFLDANLRLQTHGQPVSRFKTTPPWARTRILDPETLHELGPGETGLLCHVDLANRASVCSILTEDLGVACGSGFEILGRVQGSEARGCSIAMDELLVATGRA